MADPTTTQTILGEIQKFSKDLAARRSQYGAAIWSVSDFFSHLEDLIPCVDRKALFEEEGFLSLQKDPKGEQWGLFVLIAGEEAVAAHKVDPQLMVAAIRRLPEFLIEYCKQLKACAGSELTLNQAKSLQEAVQRSNILI